jgi:hypothetical protein
MKQKRSEVIDPLVNHLEMRRNALQRAIDALQEFSNLNQMIQSDGIPAVKLTPAKAAKKRTNPQWTPKDKERLRRQMKKRWREARRAGKTTLGG